MFSLIMDALRFGTIVAAVVVNWGKGGVGESVITAVDG
jgi:hypothetical protein